MASKKKISIEVDADAVKKLVAASEALSELANAWVMGSDDPALRALAKGAKKKSAKKK